MSTKEEEVYNNSEIKMVSKYNKFYYYNCKCCSREHYFFINDIRNRLDLMQCQDCQDELRVIPTNEHFCIFCRKFFCQVHLRTYRSSFFRKIYNRFTTSLFRVTDIDKTCLDCIAIHRLFTQ